MAEIERGLGGVEVGLLVSIGGWEDWSWWRRAGSGWQDGWQTDRSMVLHPRRPFSTSYSHRLFASTSPTHNSSEPSLTAHSRETGESHHNEGHIGAHDLKARKLSPTTPVPQRERRLPPASETPSVSDMPPSPHVLIVGTRHEKGPSPCASSIKFILLRGQAGWRQVLGLNALFPSPAC